MATRLTEAIFGIYPNRPNTAILMSGQGTNAEALLSSAEVRGLYNITTVFTDRLESNAGVIADTHGLRYMADSKKKFADSKEREAYFEKLAVELGRYGIEATLYTGFMKVTTSQFAESFPGLNVHPANLLIKDAGGIPKYRGMDALPMMRREQGYIQATVHVIDTPVDSGSAIAVSECVYASSYLSDAEAHDLLKVEEHKLFPNTLIKIGNRSINLENIPWLSNEAEIR